MLTKLFTAAAIASMATAPVVAAPAAPVAPIAKLSLTSVRASTHGSGKSKVAPAAIVIGLLAVAAVVGGAVALSDSDDTPDSP